MIPTLIVEKLVCRGLAVQSRGSRLEPAHCPFNV